VCLYVETLIGTLDPTPQHYARHQHWSTEDLLTSQELAEALKISVRTPENWRLKGEGPPFIRVGKRRCLYRWREVLEYLDARRFSSTSEEQAA
jgi:hypothetical protein